MANLINRFGPVEDRWQIVEILSDEFVPAQAKRSIFPVELWRELQPQFKAAAVTPGILLDADQDLEEIADLIPELPLIAVNFTAFANGTGFSTGAMLRERYGFSGELRATGTVILDQMSYLRRCGFSEAEVTEEAEIAAAVEKFSDGVVSYQGSINQQRTPFKRRFG